MSSIRSSGGGGGSSWATWTDMVNELTGVPTTLSGFGITDAQGAFGVGTDGYVLESDGTGGYNWVETPDGLNAPTVQTEYSPFANQASGHSFEPTYNGIVEPIDIYMRISVDGGSTWGSSLKIAGEDGATGAAGADGAGSQYYEYIFKNSASQPALGVSLIDPTNNNGADPVWSDTPEGGAGHEWMSVAKKSADGLTLISNWSVPIRLSGNPVNVEYAEETVLGNGIIDTGSWSATFDPAVHLWMRQSTDGGSTWSDDVRIVGETGSGGPYVDYIFIRTTDNPPSIPSGNDPTNANTGPWYDAPQAGSNALWMSKAKKDADDTLSQGAVWSAPFLLSPTLLDVQYSIDGSGSPLDAEDNGWSSTFVPGTDKYMIQSVDGGTTYSSAIQIVGETGSAGDFLNFIFRRNATKPTKPTTNDPTNGNTGPWYDEPPVANGDKLWMTKALFVEGTLSGAWSEPIQVEGADGATGAAAKTIAIAGSGQVFGYDNATGSPVLQTTSSITLTCNRQNISGSTVWTMTDDQGADQSGSLSGKSNAGATLTEASFDALTNNDFVTITAIADGISDTFTILKLLSGADGTDGSSSSTIVLTSDSQIFGYDNSTGTPALSTASSIVFTCNRQNISDATVWTIKDSTGALLTPVGTYLSSISDTSATLTEAVFSGISNNSNIMVTATSEGIEDYVTIVELLSGQKGDTGDTGAVGSSAESIILTSDAQTFTFTNAGAYDPANQTVTLTANRQNLAGATVWSTTPTIAAIDAKTGDEITIDETEFGLSNDSVKITATSGAYSDSTTLIKLTAGLQGDVGDTGPQGDSAISGFLTNEAHVLPTDKDGGTYSLTTSGGVFNTFDGVTDVTNSATYTIQGTATRNGLTMSINGSTGAYSLSGASWTSDSEIFTLRSVYSAVIIDKQYTITKSKTGSTGADGVDPISGFLTNEVHVVGAAKNGTGYSLTSSGGTFKVYEGITDVTTSSYFEGGTTQNGLTLAINSSTGVYTLTGGSWATDEEAFTVSATYGGTQIDKVFTISKSKTGEDGLSGVLTNETHVVATTEAGTGYSLSSAGGTFTVFTALTDVTTSCTFSGTATQNGLTFTINASTGVYTLTGGSWATDEEIFTITANYSGTILTKTYTITKSKAGATGPTGAKGEDGIVGVDGTDGVSQAQLQIFIRASSAPNTPTGGSFVFDTATFTAPASWNKQPPAGSDPLYVSVGIASVAGSSGTDSSIIWGSPDLLAVDGVDGGDGNSVFQGMVFKRASSTPNIPTENDGAYNFGTNTLTPPATWSVTVPAIDGNPVYSSTAVFSINGTTGTDSTMTWSDPELFVQDGADGDDGAAGKSTFMYPIYRRSAVDPGTPTGGSFNFGTNIGTPPSNWYNSVPSGTDPVYTSNTLASIIGDTGTDSSLTWVASTMLVQDGATGAVGTDGTDGNTSAQLMIFIRSGSAPGTPSGGSFNFGTSTLTAPSSWSKSIPAGTSPVYSSVAIAQITGTTGVDSSIPWGSPELMVQNGVDGSTGPAGTDGDPGTAGTSVFQGTVFRRASSTPSTPTTNDGSYNFGTNILTAPSGWSTSVPAINGNPAYSSTATFSVVGNTGTDSTMTWSAPMLFVQDGTDGDDGAPGSTGTSGLSTFLYPIFRRASSAPATPSGGSFNFGTNTGTPPTNWLNADPGGANPLYSCNALASVTGDTGTDSSLSWSSPNKMVEHGTDGAKGDAGAKGDTGNTGASGSSSYQWTIFRRASSTPSTPSGGSFQFVNGGTSVPIPPTNWSNADPGGSNPLYSSTVLAAIVGNSGTDSSLNWSSPNKMVQDGATGGTGPAGDDGYKPEMRYQEDTTVAVDNAAALIPLDGGVAKWSTSTPSNPSSPVWMIQCVKNLAGNIMISNWTNPVMLNLDYSDSRIANDAMTLVDFKAAAGWTNLPEDGATSDTWGTLSGQPSDTDILNINTVWSDVAGTTNAPENNATNTTNTNQLTDGANLGGTADWGSVSGSGKPANNADVTSVNIAAGFAGQENYENLHFKTGGGSGDVMTVSGNVIERTAGSGWDLHAYSEEYFIGPCVLTFKAGTTNETWMLGINTDPVANTSYTSIDYCFYQNGTDTVAIYESGSSEGTVATYTTSSVFSIVNDGEKVKYYVDGALEHTSSNIPSATAAYYIDSSFNSLGSKANIISFTSGPSKLVNDADKNSAISISSAGVLSGAGGGTVAIGSLAGSPVYKNSNVTINADGSLGGAGAGTVAISSLSGSTNYLNTQISLSAAGVLTGAGTSSAVNLSSLAGTVGNSQIANDAVTNSKIGPDAITETEIADDAVTAAQITANAVTASEIAADTIVAGNIAANAIGASEIATNAVTTNKILAGAITATKIASNTITATQIASNAINASELNADAVTATHIAANAIEAGAIKAGAVVADAIATNAVTTNKILAGAITTNKLDAGAITAEKIATGTITADKIGAGEITANEIATNSIASDKLAATKLSAISADMGVVTGGTFQTASTGQRCVMTSDGDQVLTVYDSSNVPTFYITGAGNLTFSGKLAGGIINDIGLFGQSILEQLNPAFGAADSTGGSATLAAVSHVAATSTNQTYDLSSQPILSGNNNNPTITITFEDSGTLSWNVTPTAPNYTFTLQKSINSGSFSTIKTWTESGTAAAGEQISEPGFNWTIPSRYAINKELVFADTTTNGQTVRYRVLIKRNSGNYNSPTLNTFNVSETGVSGLFGTTVSTSAPVQGVDTPDQNGHVWYVY